MLHLNWHKKYVLFLMYNSYNFFIELKRNFLARFQEFGSIFWRNNQWSGIEKASIWCVFILYNFSCLVFRFFLPELECNATNEIEGKLNKSQVTVSVTWRMRTEIWFLLTVLLFTQRSCAPCIQLWSTCEYRQQQLIKQPNVHNALGLFTRPGRHLA